MMMIRNKFNINQHFVRVPRIVCQIASGFFLVLNSFPVGKTREWKYVNSLRVGQVSLSTLHAAHTHMTGAQRSPGNSLSSCSIIKLLKCCKCTLLGRGSYRVCESASTYLLCIGSVGLWFLSDSAVRIICEQLRFVIPFNDFIFSVFSLEM